MPPERRALVVAASVTVAALLLLSGIVLWRLTGPTYSSDVATICSAEARSGFALRREMSALDDWMRGQVATPSGNVLLAKLGDLPMADRGAMLRAEASAVAVAPCPLADSYEALVAEGVTRADFQRLCSYVTFPELATRGDAARLAALERWLATQATDPATKALADPLRAAATPAERARILRAASREAGLLTCDVARVIETPLPPPDAGAPAIEGGAPEESDAGGSAPAGSEQPTGAPDLGGE